MSKPIIALVGRPNVGKSTLFNRLTRSRDAIVADYPGLTRDRQYGTGRLGKRPYIVVDTGGLSGETEGVDPLMAGQVRAALDEADAVLFLVDGRQGILPADEVIANYVRLFDKPVQVLVNKAEGYDHDLAKAEFFQLGLGDPIAISSAHGDNVEKAIDHVIEQLPEKEEEDELELDAQPGIRVAVIGRPNVGKSTLINRMIGEERVVAFDMPGTTRDSIFVPFERDGKEYTLIDTAGVRRRKNIKEKIEKFSIVKAIEAMEQSHVVILVIDGSEGLTDQDLTLLGLAIESGRGLVLAVNKWDNLTTYQREQVKHELDSRLQFVEYAKKHLISALHGSGVGELFKTVQQVHEAAFKKVSTSDLNRVLEQAVLEHQPPLIAGRRVKLRYAHLGGLNPPRVIVHGNQVDKLPEAYTRYLTNVFRKAFKWIGTPVTIEYKATQNPFEGRKSKPKVKDDRQKIDAMMRQRKKKKKMQKKRVQ
ncbi:ribosome biogenesis GTPase Der [Thiomicrorhabdus sp. 6S3-12]|uniref:ribosome biogenesis GTPase Der n=1 Tax=Thiomicrorhabdus sp. 6S3-12 TaxID=2819681 RepID=UPI001AACEC55|nr:ribosome biogenesis GTPase Der [Thiomicrorhabdus sp. 6S3-12]MBO1923595.1 ribosome biogenesis GTPase Der [Thiomicrorhabdus sp. 6S3-12]